MKIYMSAFLSMMAYYQDQSTSKIDGLPSRILFSALCYGLQMQMENQMHSGFCQLKINFFLIQQKNMYKSFISIDMITRSSIPINL